MNKFVKRRIAVTLALFAALSLFYFVIRGMTADAHRQYTRSRQWYVFAHQHCHLINVSAGGGWAREDLAAYHCDDGHDYVSSGNFAPDDFPSR